MIVKQVLINSCKNVKGQVPTADVHASGSGFESHFFFLFQEKRLLFACIEW